MWRCVIPRQLNNKLKLHCVSFYEWVWWLVHIYFCWLYHCQRGKILAVLQSLWRGNFLVITKFNEVLVFQPFTPRLRTQFIFCNNMLMIALKEKHTAVQNHNILYIQYIFWRPITEANETCWESFPAMCFQNVLGRGFWTTSPNSDIVNHTLPPPWRCMSQHRAPVVGLLEATEPSPHSWTTSGCSSYHSEPCQRLVWDQWLQECMCHTGESLGRRLRLDQ